MESESYDGIDIGDSFSITSDDYDLDDFYDSSSDTYDLSSYESYTTGTSDSSLDEEALLGIFGAGFAIYMAVMLAIGIIMIIAMWKLFKKAGRNGWESIIPIYSNWVLFEIVGMKGWYALLALVPFVGTLIAMVLSIICLIKLAKCFGKSGGYAAGLILLPVVFLPMLGFGKDQYLGPEGAPNNYGYNPQGPTPNYGNPNPNQNYGGPTPNYGAPTPMNGPVSNPNDYNQPPVQNNQFPSMGNDTIPQQDNDQHLEPPAGL